MEEVEAANKTGFYHSPPMTELEEVDEELLSTTRENTSITGEEVPHYVAVLNQLLGPEQANEYLHPTAEQMTVSATGGILRVGAPKLPRRPKGLPREVTSLSEHSFSANQLWTLLREDTQADIEDIESRNYERLRDAYDSLVRQCIVKREMPEILKDLKSHEWNAFQRLIQRSTLARLKEQRRLQELMFRISKSNTAKQDIILHNNALPDFTNRWGKESVNSFIPQEYLLELETCRLIPSKYVSKTSTSELYDLVKEFRPATQNRSSSQTTSQVISRLGLRGKVNVSQLRSKPSLPEHLTHSYRFLKESDNNPSGRFREQQHQQHPVPTIFERTLKDAQKRREMEMQKQEKDIQQYLNENKLLRDLTTNKGSKSITSRINSSSQSAITSLSTGSRSLTLSSMLHHAHTKSYVPPKTRLHMSTESDSSRYLSMWSHTTSSSVHAQ